MFTPPRGFLPQNVLIDTAPLSRSVGRLGNVLAAARERENNIALGEEAQSGGLSALKNAAFGQGKIGMALQARNMLAQDAVRKAQLAKLNRAPTGPAPTATMRHFEMAQKNPEFAKFLDSRKPGTTINMPFEKSFDKTMGQIHGKWNHEMQLQGAKAKRSLGRLKVMEDALSDPNLYKGKGGEWVLGFKKTLQTAGVKVRGVESGELAQRLTNELALERKGDLPGPMSDSDREFLRSLPASVMKSAEGNRWIIALARTDAEYKDALASTARAYMSANGGRLDGGFYTLQAELAAKFKDRYSELVGNLKTSTRAEQAPVTAGFPRAVNPRTGEILELRDGKLVKVK